MIRPHRSAWIVVAAIACACGDPTHDDAVSALGPEAPGVRPGPMHRPGQPCLACHGGDGPGNPTMAFAGTVYSSDASETPVPNALVRVADADGRGYEVTTNCAGNFWAPADDFTLTFPANGAVTTPGAARVMLTHTNRAGSCSDCHGKEPSPTTPGRLWVKPPARGGSCTTGFGGGEPFFTGACDKTPPTCTTTPSYSDVASILASRCTACHGPGGQSSNDDFTSEARIVGTKKATTAASNVLQCKMPPPPLARPTNAERTALYCYFQALGQANP
jgi:hypothetical protein